MKKFLIILATTLSLAAMAQTYPQKEISLVNPTPPATTVWNLAKIISDYQDSSGSKVRFNIVNKPGGEKMVAANFTAESAADGYTLSIGQNSDLVMLPLIKPPGIKFDENSFVPVVSLAAMDMFLIVPANSPANNLKEYLDMIRRDPNTRALGNAGNFAKLLGFRAGKLADTELTSIPYASDAKMIIDLDGSHLPAAVGSLSAIKTSAKGGLIKVIACFGRNRSVEFPEVKTMNEQYPGMIDNQWFALFAPKGTPPDVIAIINKEINLSLANPKLQQELEKQGYVPQPMTLGQVTQFYQTEIQKYRPLVEKYLR